MKKLLSTIALLAIVISCATVAVKEEPLIAEYYKTYATKTAVVTEQEFPEQDCFWVKEEAKGPDEIVVVLVWSDYYNGAIGVMFDNVKTEQPFDYCGVMYFGSVEDVDKFKDTFDTNLIVNGHGVDCGAFIETLKSQLNTVHPRPEVAGE